MFEMRACMLKLLKASTSHADHTICDALQKQGIEEAATLLLGGLSEVRRQRKAETRDDLGGVRVVYLLFTLADAHC